MPRRSQPGPRTSYKPGDTRGRHKKASSSDVMRRLREWERIDWRGLEGEGKAA